MMSMTFVAHIWVDGDGNGEELRGRNLVAQFSVLDQLTSPTKYGISGDIEGPCALKVLIT